VRYPDVVRSLGAAAGDVLAAVRRRSESRSPRARVRMGHGEAKILPADSPAAERLLTLARELVDAYERDATGRHGRGR
jgi:hypothetical protein